MNTLRSAHFRSLGTILSLGLALMGCGAQATTASARPTTSTSMAVAPAQPVTELVASNTAGDVAVLAGPTLDRTALPDAPWAGAPIAASEAPRALMNAWHDAENREWCAPIAPRSMGAATGARARSSRVAGGWLVEFDRPGLPGVDRAGNECDTCGRSVFGIAGTSMAPEELLGPDAEILTPTYADGSHAIIEISDGDGESVASATFTVGGQGCVYEVWSFLGEDHLHELVNGLRFVEPSHERGTAIARAD